MAPKRRNWLRRAMIIGLSVLTVCGLAAAGSNATVLQSGRGHIYRDAKGLPHTRVAIVLGCSPVFAGQPNAYFMGRIRAAAELYKAGVVERLLVSGDNGRVGYDEPTAMQEALVKQGVPAEHVTKDYAGFHTLDTMVRAHKVFGLTEAVIVTDEFHMARSLYLAQKAGLDATGYPSETFPSAAQSRLEWREFVARVEAVWDTEVIHAQPKFLGAPVTIQ